MFTLKVVKVHFLSFGWSWKSSGLLDAYYYSSLLHETNSFIAIRDTECMLFDDLLNETDTSKPVYAIIETKKFPNEDGTLPLFGSIKIIGGNLGLEYTKQDYLDHLAKLSWISQVTFMSSQTGFTGPIEVYRLS